jgi:uncharacterized membrane protein
MSPVAERMQVGSERTRVVVCAAVGIAVGVAAALAAAPWQLAVLAGWIAASGLLLVWIWSVILPLEPAETAEFARREDDSRAAASLLLVTSSIMSLIAVGFALLRAANAKRALEVVLTAAGGSAVILAWGVVHTVFVLRYARLYYTEPVGGIDFSTDELPDYGDFAYMAFTIGMTYQISDTDVAKRSIRRAVLRHALLAYVFGTAFVAFAINLVAGLAR